MNTSFLSKISMADRLWLILGIIIGVFFRFNRLNFQSLWMDELYSVQSSLSNNWSDFYSIWTAKDSNPPLFQVVLRGWVSLFGSSEISVRLPSAIAGCLAVILMYFLTRKFFSQRIATLSTILLAFSGHAIGFSQETRAYSFLILGSVGATLFWLEQVDWFSNEAAKSRPSSWLYLFSALLASYSHYFGALLTGLQFLYLAALSIQSRPVRPTEVVKVYIGYGILFFPWFLFHLSTLMAPQAGPVASPPSSFHFEAITYAHFAKNFFGLLFWKAPVLVLILVIPGALLARSKYKLRNLFPFETKTKALIFLVLVPLFLFSLAALKDEAILTIRYFVFLLPACYLLAAIWISRAFESAGDRIGWLSTPFTFLVCLIELFFAIRLLQGTPYKEQWRQGIVFIGQETKDKSTILVAGVKRTAAETEKYSLYVKYYLGQLGFQGKDIDVIALPVKPNITSAELGEFFRQNPERKKFIFLPHTPVWFIESVENAAREAGILFRKEPFIDALVLAPAENFPKSE